MLYGGRLSIMVHQINDTDNQTKIIQLTEDINKLKVEVERLLECNRNLRNDLSNVYDILGEYQKLSNDNLSGIELIYV